MIINVTPCTQNGKAVDEESFVDDPKELLGKPYHFKVFVDCFVDLCVDVVVGHRYTNCLIIHILWHWSEIAGVSWINIVIKANSLIIDIIFLVGFLFNVKFNIQIAYSLVPHTILYFAKYR